MFTPKISQIHRVAVRRPLSEVFSWKKYALPYYRQFRAKTPEGLWHATAQVIWLIFGVNVAVYGLHVDTKRHPDIKDSFFLYWCEKRTST